MNEWKELIGRKRYNRTWGIVSQLTRLQALAGCYLRNSSEDKWRDFFSFNSSFFSFGQRIINGLVDDCICADISRSQIMAGNNFQISDFNYRSWRILLAQARRSAFPTLILTEATFGCILQLQ